MKLLELTKSPWYWLGVAVVALGVRTAVGVSVYRISSKIKSPSKEMVEWASEHMDELYGLSGFEDDGDSFPSIPEGVNIVESGEPDDRTCFEENLAWLKSPEEASKVRTILP